MLAWNSQTVIAHGESGTAGGCSPENVDFTAVRAVAHRIGNQIGASAVQFVFDRITSYNVCYTKLLRRKFMHLGFHIYDVGFQSPNVDAARPLVYATALLLVLIIVVLNLTAIMLRSRLENRYRGVES